MSLCRRRRAGQFNFGRRRRRSSVLAVKKFYFKGSRKNFVLSSKFSDDLFTHCSKIGNRKGEKAHSKNAIGGAPTNYRRRRADQQRRRGRQQIVGGGDRRKALAWNLFRRELKSRRRREKSIS